MKVTVIIENVGGVFYINHKRLGHDVLSELEKQVLNEFIKEFKENKKQNLSVARQKYFRNELKFDELNVVFFENADADDLEMFYRSPVFDRPSIIEGKNQKQRDQEFEEAIN